MPGSATCRSPTAMASEATTKNQPPDIDIIVFQIRPGMANGTSRRQKRCHGRSKNRGWPHRDRTAAYAAPEKKLNAMFQAWLVKIAKIAASSTPNALSGDNETKKTTVNER